MYCEYTYLCNVIERTTHVWRCRRNRKWWLWRRPPVKRTRPCAATDYGARNERCTPRRTTTASAAAALDKQPAGGYVRMSVKYHGPVRRLTATATTTITTGGGWWVNPNGPPIQYPARRPIRRTWPYRRIASAAHTPAADPTLEHPSVPRPEIGSRSTRG